MPNQYTHDGNKWYIVAGGRTYECNVAHPLPLPEGIESGEDRFTYDVHVVFGGPHSSWVPRGPASADTHWLARAPLPEVPRPKTQAEKDDEAYLEWFRGVGMISTHNAWNAALAHARQQQP